MHGELSAVRAAGFLSGARAREDGGALLATINGTLGVQTKVVTVALLVILAGCSTIQEVRESGKASSVASRLSSAALATCILQRADGLSSYSTASRPTGVESTEHVLRTSDKRKRGLNALLNCKRLATPS